MIINFWLFFWNIKKGDARDDTRRAEKKKRLEEKAYIAVALLDVAVASFSTVGPSRVTVAARLTV